MMGIFKYLLNKDHGLKMGTSYSYRGVASSCHYIPSPNDAKISDYFHFTMMKLI